MKQITISVPDNYELKQDGNTYTIVEKEKKLTYDDVADKIFPNGVFHYYIQNDGNIMEIKNFPSNYKLPNNALSKKQLEKLLAINKLMNVAKYLNDDWQPDWHYNYEEKYYININGKQLKINSIINSHCNDVYFKSAALAKQAIEILGEETIRLALCTDY